MSSSSSSSSSTFNNTELLSESPGLDQLVFSYLHEKGFTTTARKFVKALKLKGLKEEPTILPGGTLAAAVAGTRKNTRARKPRARQTPFTAYELFTQDRKAKFNLIDGQVLRNLVRTEWESSSEAVQEQYRVKHLQAKEAFYLRYPEKIKKSKTRVSGKTQKKKQKN